MKKSIFRVLILAFLLRIIVSPLAEHGDVVSYYWWSKDLLNNGFSGFYDRNIANTVRPTYPPVTSYLFLSTAHIHEIFWKVNWELNTHIGFYPSSFVFWIESDRGWYFFNKLPAIFADLGIVFLLYKIGESLKNARVGMIAASFFAFIPTFWYNSALWGQTDSVFALFILAAFFALYKDRFKMSILLYGLAILTKPTAFFSLPVFLAWFFKKSKPIDWFFSAILVLGEIVVLYFPFHPVGLVPWIIEFYKHSLSGELGYLVANAFNFWALIFGFDNRPDNSLFLGIHANSLGNFIVIVFVGLFVWIVLKKRTKFSDILLIASVTAFSVYLFLPRMHDRYFYSALLLLTPVAAFEPKFRKIFFGLSFIHLVNLYHYWWVPKIGILISFFSNIYIEKILIAMNIMSFVLLLKALRLRFRGLS